MLLDAGYKESRRFCFRLDSLDTNLRRTWPASNALLDCFAAPSPPVQKGERIKFRCQSLAVTAAPRPTNHNGAV